MRQSLFRYIGLVTALVMLVCVAPARYAQAQDGSGDFVPDQVLVELAPTVDLNTFLSQNGLALIKQFGRRSIYQLRITDGKTPDQKVSELTGKALKAEPNYIGQTPEGSRKIAWVTVDNAGDPSNQWAVGAIRLGEAHVAANGAGITVAVLDTGIDRNHSIFAGKTVLQGRDLVDLDDDPSEVQINTELSKIVYGHGTHVAGLVALAAPQAQIMPVRVLDAEGVGNVWVLLEGLQYAVNNGANVINLSLSFRRESSILDEIVREISLCDDADDDDDDDDCGVPGDDDDDGFDDGVSGVNRSGQSDQHNNAGSYGVAQPYAIGINDDDDDDAGDDDDDLRVPTGGVVVVAAAGNSSSTIKEYPAAEAVTGLLSVGASTETDTLASFSNRGDWVDLLAPGDKIVSALPGDRDAAWSGTSMAAPITAGVAALVRQQKGLNYSATNVVSDIVRGATPICAEVPKRLDAAAALGMAVAPPKPCVAPTSGVMLPLILR
jgi:subtilisin family serine protease